MEFKYRTCTQTPENKREMFLNIMQEVTPTEEELHGVDLVSALVLTSIPISVGEPCLSNVHVQVKEVQERISRDVELKGVMAGERNWGYKNCRKDEESEGETEHGVAWSEW